MVWPERSWQALLRTIKKGRCTPFLGAGACADVLPLGKEIARAWAAEYKYPFQDISNLPRVAQYAAIVEENALAVKLRMAELLKKRGTPDFSDLDQPHRVLANLPLPIYITTNYDDFMMMALRECDKKPRRAICKWYRARDRKRNLGDSEWKQGENDDDETAEPTPESPVVFHLHGTLADEDSMVLIEDDYLDFLIHANKLIPWWIERAFTDSSLLFMGYSFEDINFKVMFRKLAPYLHFNAGSLHVAVQLDPEGDEPTEEERQLAERQRQYLEQEFNRLSVRIFWGTCAQFAAGLRERWERMSDGQ